MESLSGKTILSNSMHSLKALLPISFTLEGIVILFNPWQYANPSILVTPSGIITFSIFSSWLPALSPRATILYVSPSISIVEGIMSSESFSVPIFLLLKIAVWVFLSIS